MRPILFQIPAVPVPGWIALLALLLGLSTYWSFREVRLEGLAPEEQRRRNRGTLLFNALFFLVAAALLWQFRDRVAQPLPVRAYGFFDAGFRRRPPLPTARRPGQRCRPRAPWISSWDAAVAVVCARLLHRAAVGQLRRQLARLAAFGRGLSFMAGWPAASPGLPGTWRHRLPFWWLADLTPPEWLWVRRGPHRLLPERVLLRHAHRSALGVCFADPPLSRHLTPPSHPVQLYATLANLAIFGLLLGFLKRKRYDGQLFGLYLVFYSVYRFLAEGLRKGVTGEVLGLGLTEAQWASLAIAGWVRPDGLPSRPGPCLPTGAVAPPVAAPRRPARSNPGAPRQGPPRAKSRKRR